MITRNTVFVLGAGAHCSYGFPSGEDLKNQIYKRARSDLNLKQEYSLVSLLGRGLATSDEIEKDNILAFAESLKNSGQPSIDAFLDANRHMPGYVAIGKALIAQVLCGYEESIKIFDDEFDDDWLSYLFYQMLGGARTVDEFVSNKICFVTFNYDRTLERWLLTKIKNSFGIEENRASEVLKRFPIKHVYGRLRSPISGDDKKNKFQWVESLETLRLIYEAERGSDEVSQARALVRAAEVVCLLGFGFHKENVDLIDLPIVVANGKIVVHASRYGITNIEWQRTRAFFPGGKINEAIIPDYKCLDTLRNMPIF